MAFELDAKGEPIRAGVTRWDGEQYAMERMPVEAAETFRLRVGIAAGNRASTQAYVLSELRRYRTSAEKL